MSNIVQFDGEINPYARLLYDAGYNLIPIIHAPGTKHHKKPKVKWKEYQISRVPPEVMENWMKPELHVPELGEDLRPIPIYDDFALITGRMDYAPDAIPIICLDGDDAEAVELVKARCPPTPAMSDGSRGRHHIYRRPSNIDVPYLGNRQKMTIDGKKYNLDLRGDGGYFIIPGSRGKTAVVPWTLDLLRKCPVYDWRWLLPGDTKARPDRSRVSFASVPREYEDQERQLRVRAAQRHLERSPGAIQGQGADNYCFALTNTLLHAYGLNEDDTVSLLVEWGAQQDHTDGNGSWYPWTESQIQHKVADAMAKDPQVRRYSLHEIKVKLDEQSLHDPDEITQILQRTGTESVADPTDEPSDATEASGSSTEHAEPREEPSDATDAPTGHAEPTVEPGGSTEERTEHAEPTEEPNRFTADLAKAGVPFTIENTCTWWPNAPAASCPGSSRWSRGTWPIGAARGSDRGLTVATSGGTAG
jgi:hypothetical protein